MESEMTLQKAIDHLKDTLSDNDHKWNCDKCREENEQLLEWLIELQKYRKVAKQPTG